MNRFVIAIIFAFGCSALATAQCTNTWQYGSAAAPTTVGSSATMSTCNYQDEYSYATGVVAGNVYTVDYSLGGCITVHSGSSGGPVVSFGTAPVTFTATVSGTYYFSYNTSCNNCNTATNCGTSTIQLVSAPGGGGGGGCVGGSNNTCATADPFCTGTAYNYCNSTGVADMGAYDCLSTTPNPMWMYLNVSTSGSITIDIEQFDNSGWGIDVDFALYGPYNSLSSACNINGNTATVDCSYSIFATETAVIPSAVAGQYYVLLITNYEDVGGYIQFSQTGGTGATNCSIVLPVDLLGLEAANSGEANVIKWKCLTETNTKSFSVERSANGAEFELAGTVAAAGNSATPTSYELADAAYRKNQINYYRLKQEDLNGRVWHSAVVEVDNRVAGAPYVIKRVDMMGREIDPVSFEGIYVEYLSDGTVRKGCCKLTGN